MAPQVPQKVQIAAVVQIVSGVVNMLLMALSVSTVLAGVAGVAGGLIGALLSAVGCPLGCLFAFSWMCGLWGLALLPIGILEVICGAATLMDPDSGGPFLRVAMITELVSVIFGGLVSFGAGFVVMGMLRDPEVTAFLTASDRE
ncbi:MAG: hypothetical protein KC621_09595 [Myxococcales bacterium]|nr:hypothetical protein [Myxococcales bacterium]